jgi:DNA-binding GntR family transcriptional regulator
MKPIFLRDEAYGQIRQKMVLGELPGGSELSEPMLAEMLGISRTPVREALQQLEVEGFVERTPRRGTVVRVPEKRDIVDLYELREALESHAVMLAAERRTPDDLTRLHTLCTEMNSVADQLEQSGESVLTGPMMRRFLAADMGFHMLLIHSTGNRHLMKIVGDSHVMSRIFGTARQAHNLKIVQTAYRVHRDILRAVENSESAKARELMILHIEQSLHEALEHFEAKQPEDARAERVVNDLPLPFDLLDEFKRIGLDLGDAGSS